MGYWTLDDIPWERFDRSKLDPDVVRIVKAASLVEYNGGAYAHHLCRIFHDDIDFQRMAQRWGEEEIQHGRALARWAGLADPSYDFNFAFDRFQAGYRIDFASDASRRGSRSGEMIARCMVEVGTSSYYSALRDSVQEPVLKEICRKIAADEIRHYRLFFKNLGRYVERDQVGLWRRFRVALRRIAEAEDDELAYAYYAANETSHPYDRRRYSRAYARRALALYQEHHVRRMTALVFRAVGLSPHSRLARAASRLVWRAMRYKLTHLVRVAA
jgi:rubrerythrin